MSRLQKIQQLKEDLFNTDYKVNKCAECFMLGIELPYNLQELVEQRNSMRSQINELEIMTDTIYNERYPQELLDDIEELY